MSFTSFSPTLIEYTAPQNISCRSIEGSRFEFLNSRNWLICVDMANTITLWLLAAVRLLRNSCCW
jgi:uncharacterized lipoprotein